MKRFLLFVMMCVCVSIGALAATTDLKNDQGQVVARLTVDGNSAVLNVIVANASISYNDKGQLNNLTDVKVTGYMPQDIFNVNQWSNGLRSCERLDLSGVTDYPSGNFDLSQNSSISGLILPSNADFSAINSNSVKYIIKSNTGDSEANAVKVWAKNDSNNDWASDPVVLDADYIKAYTDSGESTYVEGDVITNLQSSKWVNGEGNVFETVDFTYPSSEFEGMSLSQALETHLSTKKIGKCTISGELSDLAALYGIKVQSFDLSGVTNTDITGLVLPTITDDTQDIFLPNGITYSSEGALTSSTSTSLTNLDAAIKALKDNGKTASSVNFPGGSSYSSDVLIISNDDKSNIMQINNVIKDGGLSLNTINVGSDVVYDNGELTLNDLTIASDLCDLVNDNGLNVSKITFPNGTIWENGNLTVNAADNTVEGLTAIKNLLDNAGKNLGDITFPNETTYSGGIVNVSNRDKDEDIVAGTDTQLKVIHDNLNALGLIIDNVRFDNGTRWNSDGTLTYKNPMPDDQKTKIGNALTAANFNWTETSTSACPDLEYSVGSDGKVTIKSYKEGALEKVLNARNEGPEADMYNYAQQMKTDIPSTKENYTLVLEGAFKANDLSKFTSDVNNKATSVNMSEATFENYNDMKFTYWSNTITNAVTSNYAPDNYLVGKSNNTFNGCSHLVSVTYNSGVVDGVANNASDIPNFTTVVIGANATKIGSKAFQNITSITTLDGSAAERLTVIEDHAFSGCSSFSGDGTGEFHVPNSVQTIEEAAFESCYGIVNLYFDAASQINSIEARAFWMASEGDTNLKNVYVNVNPAREVPCAKGAFSKTDCCNQTAVGTARARLHYPPMYYDFYVGEYKSQYNGGGITQSYLDQAYAAASNGWQEFMSSGILMPDGVNWRTFSDEVPYYVPDSPASDGTVREIYLVHGYDAAKGAILVRMKVGDIIPKNTGVIVHYTFNTSGGAALYLPPVLTDQRDDEGHVIGRIVDPVADAKTPYDEELYPSDDKRYIPTDGTEYFKNYLKKLNKVTVYIDNVEIENGQKTYRNYFFCNNDEMKTTYAAYQGNEWSEECLNGWGFLRAVHGNYTISNKAYLHFPATEGFPGADLVGIQEDHGKDTNTSSAKLFGFTTIDENGFEFECVPVLQGIATSVKNVEPIVNDDSFYNMQGMKVENPSKGIYIKNGKKYVIK